MRQVGTIEHEQQARRLTAYLITRGIAAQAEHDGTSWEIWVREEDQFAEARREYESFLQDPESSRFQGVERAAQAIQREEALKRARAQRNLVDVRRGWSAASPGSRAVWFLIIASAAVSLLTDFGMARRGFSGELLWWIVFSPAADWRVALEHGQIWRTVTPIFLHLGVIHLVFNMMWLHRFGLRIARLRGWWRFLLLVLLVAVVSNVSQAISQGPSFGGMSGVVYGLFGYVWLKSRLQPTSGFSIEDSELLILLVWLFLAPMLEPWIGPVANVAHFSGLLAGLAVGAASLLLTSK